MKRRLGGLLSLTLGIVLIAGGALSGGGSGVVGLPPTPCQVVTSGAAPDPCPTGTITLTENTANAPRARSAAEPGDWHVTITAANGCTSPGGGAVDDTVTVPRGSSATSEDVYVYTDISDRTKCTYTLTPSTVAGYTATFSPSSPVSLGDPTFGTQDDLAVTLTETPAAATSSSTAPSSAAPTRSSSHQRTHSAAASASASASAAAESSAGADALADTGPRSSVTFSLILGIALCLLGLALLFAGQLPGPGRRAR